MILECSFPLMQLPVYIQLINRTQNLLEAAEDEVVEWINLRDKWRACLFGQKPELDTLEFRISMRVITDKQLLAV